MSKGSEWKRWDFHVHTASSEDYQYKQDDADVKLVEAWKNNEIKVVAITDHFMIDAERINNLRNLAPDMTIFPGVELRTDKGSSNIHVIIIFSEKLDLIELKQDFDVIMLKQKAKGKKDGEPSHFASIYWDYKDIIEFAEERGGIISIHAGSKSNGVDDKISNKDDDNKFFKMMVKTEYAESVKIYEVGNMKSLNGYLTKVLPEIGKRPVIICSDNHNPTKYTYSEKLWIKADNTFDGLIQAIEHSDERVYVGEEPVKKTHEKLNSQHIVKSIKVTKKDLAKNKEKWFDFQLDLNSSLVTIIGNKGSGKSALSDIIGLIGNSSNIKDEFASFLNEDRFNRAPKYFGRDYKAEIEWMDDHKNRVDTLEITNNEESSRIQYLPQKYIEKVCSNLDDNFQNEINKVLYSYLDNTEKLEAKNFNEFIEKKTNVIQLKINSHKEKLKKINESIIGLEKKKSKSYFKYYLNKLADLEQELNRRKNSKPKEVEKPEQQDNQEISTKIELIEKEIVEIQSEIDIISEKIIVFQNQKNKVETLSTKVKIEQDKLDSLNTEIEENLSMITNDHKKFTFEFKSPIQELNILTRELNIEINNLQEKKSLQNPKSLAIKLESLISQKNKLVQESDSATRSYQKYISELNAWEKSIREIQDDNDSQEDSIKFVKKEIEYLNKNLNLDYEKKIEERKKIIKLIFKEKKEIISMYEKIYSPIGKELSSILKQIDNGITFSAILTISSFEEELLSLINKQHNSIFRGGENSQKEIQNLLKKVDLNNFESVYKFIESVINGCKLDNDFDKLDKVIKNKERFYEILCDLEYIKADYNLTLYGKELSQLSPGERGLILLIFYLVLSKDKHPIIIDQPEDNLDNESIYTKLVPCILEAKKNRQVIIVTHNPNIAVACDSEQIIVAKIDKINNRISYRAGSIEDEGLNKNLVDILEGTTPAFSLRNRKYMFK